MGVRFFSLVRSFAALPIPRPIGSLFTALGVWFFLFTVVLTPFSHRPLAPRSKCNLIFGKKVPS